MSLPSERQFSSLELSAIIVVAVCVVCVLYMWLVLQTCRAPLRDSSVPWSCPPSLWLRSVWCVSYICGWYYRHVAPLWWETVQFPGVVRHHRGSGLCGVCPIYVVGVTDMSRPSERQFSSLELSAIIVVAVCVVCVLYMWLVLQTCRSPLRDSSVPWSCRPSSWLRSVWCVSYICGCCYRHVEPLWETVQFPRVVRYHCGCGVCGVCPIYVVVVTDMSSPSERQFSSLELSAIIVVAVCVVCVLYMWLVLQTCRSPLRDSSVPWSCRPSLW